MGEVVTKSEFARRVGDDPAAVSMWIKRGHLSGRALTADGMIDVDIAVAQLPRIEHPRITTDLESATSLAPDE